MSGTADPAVDLSEFYKYSRPKRPPCRIGAVVMPKLSPADRKKLNAALEASKDIITASAIIQWLENRDIHDIPTAAGLQGHRKKTCTCFDEK